MINRTTWMMIMIIIPICCCLGRLPGQIVAPKPATIEFDRIAVRLPTFTPTPMPASSEAAGGSELSDSDGPAGSDSVTNTVSPLPTITTVPNTDLSPTETATNVMPDQTDTPAPTPTNVAPTQTNTPTFIPLSPTPVPTPTDLPTATPIPPSPTPFPTPTPTPNDSDDDDDDDGGGGGGGEGNEPIAPVPSLPPAHRVTEGGLASLTINFTAPLPNPIIITVQLQPTGLTATPGQDYGALPSPLSVPAGVTSFTIPISTLQDLIDEFDENLPLTIILPNAILNTTVTIEDDDAEPIVSFNQSNYSVIENQGPASLMVELTAASEKTITVNYNTADGDAKSTEDYMAANGTVTFIPGETAKPINISILSDAIPECDEPFTVMFTADNAVQGTSSATVTIVNDDTQFNVTTDDNIINCNCTLREQIITFNTGQAVDMCSFSPEPVISLTAGTYSLSLTGAGEDAAKTGDLDITSDLTIIGAGADKTMIDASDLGDRAIHILAATVNISGVTIMKGQGGIRNEGTLVLSESTLDNNDLISTNNGGGLDNIGTLKINRSTLSNNTAPNGGGLSNTLGGTAILTNTTISSNGAESGGGIFNTNLLTITHTTIVSNSSTGGNGLLNTGTASFGHTIIANNTIGMDCAGTGTFVSNNYNLDSDNSCNLSLTGDITGTNPLLGPLQVNPPGSTATHAVSNGTPPYNNGNAFFVAPPTVDQRDQPRVCDGRIDIGAFEQDSGVSCP